MKLRLDLRHKLNLRHFYILLVLILPIINNYRFLPIAFIYVFGVFGIAIFCFSYKIKIILQSLPYFAYVFLLSLIIMVTQPDTEMSLIIMRLLYFVIVFIHFYVFAYQVWDFGYALRIYSTICMFVSILIIIQFALSFFGHPISLIPPGLTANTGERLSTDLIRASQISENRFSTFFLEPAHQSQYTVPCVAILLLKDIDSRNRKNLISSIIMTVAVFATTSMQGILTCGIIWSIYLFELMKMRNVRKFGRLLFLIPIIVVVGIYFLQQPIIQYQIQKKISSFNNGNISLGTSMYRRIIYGWDCYSEFDIIHKLFGCGYDNVENYLSQTGIGLRFVTIEQISYMSGLSKMFCEIGLVGVLLNFSTTIFLIVRKINKNIIVLGIFVSWIVIMLTSASFDRLESLIPLTFMMNITQIKKNEEVIVFNTCPQLIGII